MRVILALSAALLVLTAIDGAPTTAVQPFAGYAEARNNATIAAQLLLEPDAPWETFLMPAPTVVALLGQLLVVSAKTDFSLMDRAPIGGFKYIRQPTSFRASLVQITNDGWNAFHRAHTNMDQIQLYMQQVPTHVNTAVKLVSTATPTLLKRLLPISLNKINEIGDNCVNLAAQTETEFINVMQLMGEILEATVSSQADYDAKLEAARHEINVTAVQKEQLEVIGSELQAKEEQITQQLAQYQQNLDDAISNIPTGWSAVSQNIFCAVGDLIHQLPKLIGGGLGTAVVSMIGKRSTEVSSDFKTSYTLVTLKQFEAQLNAMKTDVEALLPTEPVEPVEPVELTETRSKKNDNNKFGTYKQTFIAYETMVNGPDVTPAIAQTIQQLQTAQEVSGTLENRTTSVVNPITSDEVRKSSADVLNIIGAVANIITALTPTPGAGQGQAAQAQLASYSSNSACVGGNAIAAAEMRRKLLEEAEKRREALFDEMLEYHEEMNTLMVRMSTLNLATIKFQEIIDLINEGILIIGKIREEWSRLIQFFSLVSARSKIALQQALDPFVEVAEIANDVDMDERQYLKDMLIDQVDEIYEISYFLYTLSRTYVDVSSRFVLDRLAGLAQMLAITDDTQREIMLEELFRNSEEAKEVILAMATQRKADYHVLVEQSIQAIENGHAESPLQLL